MSDYARQQDFSTKTGTTIFGAEVDEEFDALVTAVNSKVDESREAAASGIATLDAGALIPAGISGTPTSGGGQLPEASTTALGAVELATTAEAQALTDALRVITPDSLDDVLTANTGILKDMFSIADPGADAILFWDDSDSAAEYLLIGDGLEISVNTLQLPASLAGDGITLTSGVLALDAAVAGDGLAHAAGVLSVNVNNGLSIATDTVGITDVAATTTNPIDISSGAFTLDLEALTTMQGNALAATDTFLVDDGGTPKGIEYQDMGLIVQTAQTTQTLALSDANTVMEFDGTATLTIPLNATVAMPIGSMIIIVVDHATQEVTVTAAASVTLNSVFHPGGAVAASDVVQAGGTAALLKVAADEWYLAGDISDS